MHPPLFRRRAHIGARSATSSLSRRVEALALYGAMALIAAVVFGTVAYRPF